ncbi:unnamed protein product [Pleuronectes platessa]|uniref:Uncharacterized protein n=1 Tax=Pleuronectes platessa TaxID=8262 RepID=A0A9N7U849_PLEPL|nr:unnamed protein product [Pleuronectes platessa]
MLGAEETPCPALTHNSILRVIHRLTRRSFTGACLPCLRYLSVRLACLREKCGCGARNAALFTRRQAPEKKMKCFSRYLPYLFRPPSTILSSTCHTEVLSPVAQAGRKTELCAVQYEPTCFSGGGCTALFLPAPLKDPSTSPLCNISQHSSLLQLSGVPSREDECAVTMEKCGSPNDTSPHLTLLSINRACPASASSSSSSFLLL